MKAFRRLPSRMPSAYRSPKMTSRKVVVPNSTSKTPGLRTWPDTANRRVPFELSAPRSAKAAPPLATIQGRFDRVSTLLTTVGCM